MLVDRDVSLIRGNAEERYLIRRRIEAAIRHLDAAKIRLLDTQSAPCEFDYAYGVAIGHLVHHLEEVQIEMWDLRRTTYQDPTTRARGEERVERLSRWKRARRSESLGALDGAVSLVDRLAASEKVRALAAMGLGTVGTGGVGEEVGL